MCSDLNSAVVPVPAFTASGSGIAGSPGDFTFNFLTNHRTVFHVATAFYFPTSYKPSFSFSTSSPTLYFLFLKNNPNGCEVASRVILFVFTSQCFSAQPPLSTLLPGSSSLGLSQLSPARCCPMALTLTGLTPAQL